MLTVSKSLNRQKFCEKQNFNSIKVATGANHDKGTALCSILYTAFITFIKKKFRKTLKSAK